MQQTDSTDRPVRAIPMKAFLNHTFWKKSRGTISAFVYFRYDSHENLPIYPAKVSLVIKFN